MLTPKPNGYTLHTGESLLDSAPIEAIITGTARASKNGKTGEVLSVWIQRTDIEPHIAVKCGKDTSICGDCPLASGNGCYVLTHNAPLAIHRASQRGNYPQLDLTALDSKDRATLAQILSGETVRFGAYGDPAATPISLWRTLAELAKSHTSYTHQWRTASDLKPLSMASVHTPEEAELAWSQGWRTYRTGPGKPIKGKEIYCPATPEGGKKTDCNNCTLCSGASKKAKSIFAPMHGAKKGKALLAVS